MEKYFIIHVKHGRREGEGYSILIEVNGENEQDAIEQMKEKGYFDWIEDIYDTGYVREIQKTEYEQLKSKSCLLWEHGFMLGEKILAQEDFELAKKRSYENWGNESAEIGFEFLGQWITNPFLEASGRFELVDINAMYDYYSKDENGYYEYGAKEKVYNFLLKILGLHCFLDDYENS